MGRRVRRRAHRRGHARHLFRYAHSTHPCPRADRTELARTAAGRRGKRVVPCARALLRGPVGRHRHHAGRGAVLRRPRHRPRLGGDLPVRGVRRPGHAGDAAVVPRRRPAGQAALSDRRVAAVRGGRARPARRARPAAGRRVPDRRRDRVRLCGSAGVRAGHAAGLDRRGHGAHRPPAGRGVHRGLDRRGDVRPGPGTRHLRLDPADLRVRVVVHRRIGGPGLDRPARRAAGLHGRPGAARRRGGPAAPRGYETSTRRASSHDRRVAGEGCAGRAGSRRAAGAAGRRPAHARRAAVRVRLRPGRGRLRRAGAGRVRHLGPRQRPGPDRVPVTAGHGERVGGRRGRAARRRYRDGGRQRDRRRHRVADPGRQGGPRRPARDRRARAW